jgi:hypothetical protein
MVLSLPPEGKGESNKKAMGGILAHGLLPIRFGSVMELKGEGQFL